MFDKLTIRTKLIAMVAAPLAVLIVLAASGSLQRRADAARTHSDATRIAVVGTAAEAVHDLEVETLLTATVLATKDPDATKQLKAIRTQTDAAVEAFRSSLHGVDGASDVNGAVLRAAQAPLAYMDGLRSQVDRGDTDWHELTNQYFQIEDALVRVGADAFAGAIHDPDLAAGAQNAAALDAYKYAVAREATLLTGVLGSGSFKAAAGASSTAHDLWSSVDEAAGNADVQLAVFNAGSDPASRTALRNTLAGASVSRLDDTVAKARDAESDATFTGDAGAFSSSAHDVLSKIRGVEAASITTILASATSHASSASQSSRIYIGGALLAALLCLFLAIVVSASITRPLARLTAAVDHVAREQLPRLVDSLRNPVHEDTAFLAQAVPKIEISGGVELAHLGSAVSSIQQVAVEVATEQASLLRKGIGDMFVNLARRNQTLLDRQIEFIDELEAEEEDPDHLEGLYKLDHMATRMRRNAESLLVLAGAEPTRRRGRPVPLADVVRAALGEVEDYGRIDLLGLDEVLVKSTAALDVAHLLSELMENSTHFSPPDTRVEVVGHRTKADGYVVSITDHGIGMTAEQVADANEQLARPPLVGLAMSRSLGFIVIGRLAARFGINVRLMPSPTGGITAVVAIPADIVTDLPPVADDPYEPEGDAALASVTPIKAEDGGSSILPPLEFTTFDSRSDDAEADSLAEALPDLDGLDEVIAPVDSSRPGRDETTRLTRAIDPAKVAFGMHANAAAAPTVAPTEAPAPMATPPAPVAAPHAELVDVAPPAPVAPVPAPSLFSGGSAPLPARSSAPAPAAPSSLPEPLLGGPEPLPGNGPEPLPGAGSGGGLPTPIGEQPATASGMFGAHPDAGGGAGLFGHAPVRPAATGPAARGNSPFDSPAPYVAPAPAAPAPAPVPMTAPPAGNPFAPPVAAPAPFAAPAPPATEPATTGPRLFSTPTSTSGPSLFGTPPAGSPTAPAAAPTPDDGAERTSAGLVKRKPRGEGEDARKLPGSDGGARNVTTTQRSPEEVRSMLSSFRSGQRQASGAAADRNSTPPAADPASTPAP